MTLTKVMVVSYKKQLHSQLFLQILGHETLGVEGCQGRCEVERETVVNACLFQQLYLVLRCGEQAWAVIGLQYLARMFRESYGHTLEPSLPGCFLELLDQMHMAAVDSVKESYRCGIFVVFGNGYGHGSG